MTKEEQKESAARIMAKCGPLNQEELATYARLCTTPDEYPKGRVCLDCGEAFEKHQTTEHADHLATHYPTAVQWGEAHRRILQGKEAQKTAKEQ